MDNKFIYDGKLFLNSKDLCMIEFIPELIESKIDAFKIEGRMKDPLYIETVARCYREAISSYVRGTFTIEKVKKWKNKLKKVYNRGFHTGFYFKTPGIEELELDKRGNISPYKKVKFGRVISYNENSKTANIEIQKSNSKLCINDTLIIKGKNGTYTQKVEKMMKDGVKINSISCSPNEKPMIFNLVLKRPANTNDKVFIISHN
jgi:putative protease